MNTLEKLSSVNSKVKDRLLLNGEYFKQYKITNFSQLQIITCLYTNPDKDLLQKDFEDVLRLSKSTISGLLDTLEKNGVIKRVKSKKDGRSKVIKFTKKCQNSIEEMRLSYEKMEKELINNISKEDLETFIKVLKIIETNTEKGL